MNPQDERPRSEESYVTHSPRFMVFANDLFEDNQQFQVEPRFSLQNYVPQQVEPKEKPKIQNLSHELEEEESKSSQKQEELNENNQNCSEEEKYHAEISQYFHKITIFQNESEETKEKLQIDQEVENPSSNSTEINKKQPFWLENYQKNHSFSSNLQKPEASVQNPQPQKTIEQDVLCFSLKPYLKYNSFEFSTIKGEKNDENAPENKFLYSEFLSTISPYYVHEKLYGQSSCRLIVPVPQFIPKDETRSIYSESKISHYMTLICLYGGTFSPQHEADYEPYVDLTNARNNHFDLSFELNERYLFLDVNKLENLHTANVNVAKGNPQLQFDNFVFARSEPNHPSLNEPLKYTTMCSNGIDQFVLFGQKEFGHGQLRLMRVGAKQVQKKWKPSQADNYPKKKSAFEKKKKPVKPNDKILSFVDLSLQCQDVVEFFDVRIGCPFVFFKGIYLGFGGYSLSDRKLRHDFVYYVHESLKDDKTVIEILKAFRKNSFHPIARMGASIATTETHLVVYGGYSCDFDQTVKKSKQNSYEFFGDVVHLFNFSSGNWFNVRINGISPKIAFANMYLAPNSNSTSNSNTNKVFLQKKPKIFHIVGGIVEKSDWVNTSVFELDLENEIFSTHVFDLNQISFENDENSNLKSQIFSPRIEYLENSKRYITIGGSRRQIPQSFNVKCKESKNDEEISLFDQFLDKEPQILPKDVQITTKKTTEDKNYSFETIQYVKGISSDVTSDKIWNGQDLWFQNLKPELCDVCFLLLQEIPIQDQQKDNERIEEDEDEDESILGKIKVRVCKLYADSFVLRQYPEFRSLIEKYSAKGCIHPLSKRNTWTTQFFHTHNYVLESENLEPTTPETPFISQTYDVTEENNRIFRTFEENDPFFNNFENQVQIPLFLECDHIKFEPFYEFLRFLYCKKLFFPRTRVFNENYAFIRQRLLELQNKKDLFGVIYEDQDLVPISIRLDLEFLQNVKYLAETYGESCLKSCFDRDLDFKSVRLASTAFCFQNEQFCDSLDELLRIRTMKKSDFCSNSPKWKTPRGLIRVFSEPYENLSDLQSNNAGIEDGLLHYILCHKNVLVSKSTYFNLVFNSAFMEAKSNWISIDQASLDVFQKILVYFYTGVIPKINPQICVALYFLTSQFCIDEWKPWIRDCLKKFLDVSNVIQVLGMAELLQDESIKMFCMHFIANNFDAYFKKEGTELRKLYEGLAPGIRIEIQNFVMKNKKL